MTTVKGISIGKLLIGALIIFMTLNTIGFCYSKFNFNTRGTLIDIAIRDTLLEDRQFVPNTITTVEEFRAAYPNCCETHLANGALGLIAMLFFGAGSSNVYVWFEATKDSKSYSYTGVYNIDCRGINSKRRDVETHHSK